MHLIHYSEILDTFDTNLVCKIPIYKQLLSFSLLDIAPLVEKIDDPNMVNDKDLQEVVQMLDDACKDIGFFYVVSTNGLFGC